MRTEKEFVTWLKNQLMPMSDPQRIENTTSRGVPDMNVCYQGKEFWIEAKLFTGGRVLIRPEQHAWMMRRSAHSGRCFVVALHPNMSIHVWRYPDILVDPYSKYLWLKSTPQFAMDVAFKDALKTFLFTAE